MALNELTPAQAAGIKVGYTRNRWMEILGLSMDGNPMRRPKSKQKRFSGFTLKVWDKDGKELSPFRKNKFKTEFPTAEKAKEFLDLYEKMFPDLVFFVDKKYE